MARFITFNGVTIFHPGGLTKIDASDLAQVSGGTSGIVGLIGEADSGEPNSALSPKVHEFINPNSAVQMFKSGPLADAIDFVFRPSTDPRIPGGAQKILAVKTNQSTASSVTLSDQPTANDAMTVTSRTFGKAAEQLSIEVNQTAAAADPFQNKMDVTLIDAGSGTTETFTSIGGTPLMNVQYRGPSAPTVRETDAGASVHTVVSSAAPDELVITGNITTGAAVGNFVRMKAGGTATAEFVTGQMSRIRTIAFGGVNTVIELDADFSENDGSQITAANLATATFEVVREVVGPFRAVSGTANTVVMNGARDTSGSVAGDPLLNLAAGNWAANYALVTEGWCYLKIVAGTGAGQIRRINNAGSSGAVAPGVGADNLEIELEVHDDWDTQPDGTSQIMLINAAAQAAHSATDSDNDCGAQARIQGGATTATRGAADKLFLEVMPGTGEDDGGGTVIVPGGGAGGAGIAGVGYVEYYEFPLGGSISVSTLVNRIKLGINASSTNTEVASGNIDPTKTAWNARVGLGRSGDLTTDRFDFMLATGTRLTTDVTNGTNTVAAPTATSPSVDALVDFNQVFNNTWDSAGNSLKRHRLLDNLAILIDTINAQSLLMSAERDASGVAPVSNGDGVPVFGVINNLAGATVGASTFQTISNAFDQLIKHRHDTAVALFSTGVGGVTIDSIHALLEQHTINGAGAFKNEVDGIAAFDPPVAATALADVVTQANAIANRNMALVYQKPTRINAQGVRTEFGSHMLAAAIAGMQAGSPVGTPLTFKFVRAIDITSPASADPLDVDDATMMLKNGVLFSEKVSNGFRIVRNLSTFIQNDNLAFTDRNVNYELNYIAYDLRTFIENTFVGTKAIPATAVNMKDAVISKLTIYRDDLEIITKSNDPVTGQEIDAFRDLKVTISGDIATIRFEIFPTMGINFMTFEIFAQLPVISA